MKKLNLKKGMMMILGLSLGISTLNAQVPGEIDNAWAFSGWLGTDHVSNKGEVFHDMVMLDDDGFLMVGNTATPNIDMLLVKYNSDGTLNEDFGNNGVLIIDLSIGGTDAAYTAKVLWDNKIMVAGSSVGTAPLDLVLVRLEENGEIDASFGMGGVARYSAGNGTFTLPVEMHIMPDNSIIVGGDILENMVYDIALWKFTQGGGLDLNFGTNGVMRVESPGTIDHLESMVVSNDGDIFIGLTTDDGVEQSAILAKFDNVGAFDPSFNSVGVVEYLGAFSENIFTDVKIDANGKIVVVGHEGAGDNFDGMILRYNVDGSIDNTFATDGKLTLDIGASNGIYLHRLQMIQDGKMLASGNAMGQTLDQIYALIFDNTGSSDCAFSSCGGNYIDYTNSPIDYICNLSGVMSDGSILLGGYLSSQDIVGDNMFVVKVFNTNQSLGFSDNELSEAIITVYPNPTSSAFQVQLNQGEQLLNAKLIGMDGRVAQEWNEESSTYYLGGAVASGRYWLSVQTNQTSYRSSLIINK